MQSPFNSHRLFAASIAAAWAGSTDAPSDFAPILYLLNGLVHALVYDVNLHEDFLQEAAAHFLQLVLSSPTQTLSWYLQSCRYHILHLLQRGTSVDSLKRAHLRQGLEAEGDSRANNDDVVQQVAANDALQKLSRRLAPLDRPVLERLLEGCGQREAAKHLGVSHTTVKRSRRRIAAAAIGIGICPQAGGAAKRRRKIKK